MATPELTSAAFWHTSESHALSDGAPLHLASPGSILVQTSGSEGRPKWVMLSKQAFLQSAEAVNQHLRITPSDRWLIALPTHHVGGFAIYARAMLSNSKVFQSESKWNAEQFAHQCAQHAITLTSLVPTQVFDVVQSGIAAPRCLRAIVVGGGGLAKDLGQQARDLGWPVLQSYGMTEAASQIATEPLEHLPATFDPEKLEILPHWRVSVSESDHLQISGPALAEAFLIESDQEGWMKHEIGTVLTTRDQVHLWTEGSRRFLRFIGRDSQIVKVMGELVHIAALQARLDQGTAQPLQHVIVPIPDERAGSRLVLAHVDDDPTESLNRFNSIVAPYERLTEVVRLPEIPRTELGKVRFGALQRMIIERRGASNRPESDDHAA